MLSYYCNENGKVVALTEPAPDCWADLSAPEPSELESVAAAFNIPFDYLIDSLDPAERPYFLVDEGNIIIIAKAPARAGKDAAEPYCAVTMGIIITPKAIVTVCRNHGLARSLAAKIKKNGHTRSRMALALELLKQLSISYIQYLQEIDDVTTSIEEYMQRAMRNEELRGMLQIQKALIYFITALKANAMVLDKLAASTSISLGPEERELLSDVMIESKQASQMAEIYAQIVGSMSDTCASMISNNMNIAMKILTGITLLLMPPSIIVGFFGMNVALPMQGSPWAALGITAGTVAITVALWLYLAKKRWL